MHQCFLGQIQVLMDKGTRKYLKLKQELIPACCQCTEQLFYVDILNSDVGS